VGMVWGEKGGWPGGYIGRGGGVAGPNGDTTARRVGLEAATATGERRPARQAAATTRRVRRYGARSDGMGGATRRRRADVRQGTGDGDAAARGSERRRDGRATRRGSALATARSGRRRWRQRAAARGVRRARQGRGQG
jgi:hypothetical protein